MLLDVEALTHDDVVNTIVSSDSFWDHCEPIAVSPRTATWFNYGSSLFEHSFMRAADDSVLVVSWDNYQQVWDVYYNSMRFAREI